MSKYVQQISTGIVFVSTELLEKMEGMRPLKDSEAAALLGKRPRAAVEQPVEQPVDEQPVDDDPITTEPTEGTEQTVEQTVEQTKTFRELIEAAKTKEQIEALVLQHTGKDVDRRKSLAALKAEALA